MDDGIPQLKRRAHLIKWRANERTNERTTRGRGRTLLCGATYNCVLGAGMIGWMETGMKKAYALVCAAMARIGGFVVYQHVSFVHSPPLELRRRLTLGYNTWW